uniref:Uncharacterized protein n=1 Tax=Arundo donax TaxID=35708 RepID=A0A0A9E8T4_ARUDO
MNFFLCYFKLFPFCSSETHKRSKRLCLLAHFCKVLLAICS